MGADIPMPLPTTDDFMVTSANAGATDVTSATSAARIERFISVSILLLRARRRARLRVLRPFVRPVQHLRYGVQHRFARGIAVRFIGQRDVADRGAVALERHVEPLRLDWERAAVVVGLAVNQQD